MDRTGATPAPVVRMRPRRKPPPPVFLDPSKADAASITGLQRTAGNRAVAQLVRPEPPVRPAEHRPASDEARRAAGPVPVQRGVLDGVTDAVSSGVNAVTSTVSSGVNTVTGAATAAAEAAAFAAQLVTDPTALPRLLAAGVWDRMAPETKGLVINEVIAASRWMIQNGPLAVQAKTSTMSKLIQHGVLGFLDRALSYDTTFKVKVADRMMALLAHPTPEFALGFLGGFFEGLWDGVTGPFVLLWDLVKLQAKIAEFQVRMAVMLSDSDKRKMLSDDAAALIAKVEPLVAAALQEVLAGKGDPAAMAAMFDRLLAPLLEGAEHIGASVADAVVRFLTKPDRELGHGVGYVGGLATFEILLLVLTEGGYTALKEGLSGIRWIAEAMESAVALGARAEAALAPVISALARFRQTLRAFPKLEGAAGVLEDVFELFMKYLRLSYGVEGAAAGRTERAGETAGGAAGTGERAADDAAGAGERTGSRAGEAVEQGFLSERKLTNALGEDHEIHILLDGSITRCSAVCEAIAFNLGKRADALPEAMQKEGRLLVKQAEQNQRNSINAAASGIPDKDRMLQLDAIAERSATLEQKMSQLEQRAGLAGVRPQPPFARTPQELQDLARDPANKFLVDAKSQHEAAVGLDLESKNVLPGPIRRDIQPDRAEFIDINGTPWDMKSFQSATFDEKTALAQIQAELNKGENVILDLKDLNPTHQKALRDAFAATPAWNGHVVFWP